MTLDRHTRQLLRELAETGAKPISQSTPAETRELYRRVMQTNGPGPTMHRVVDETLGAEGGASARVRVLVPVPEPHAVIIYYPGGGWTAGSIGAADAIARKLAERTSCAFVLVEHRVAPEQPYPAAVEDAYLALEWVHQRVDDIADKNVPLMVAGDDSGGNLAAVVALRARDRGGPAIDMQILICPILDADIDRGAGGIADLDRWLDAEAIAWFWDQYVPVVAQRGDPDASPLRADDLSGLPPAVIVTAEHSPCRLAAEAFAQRLRDAGVAVDAQCYEGQIHGFAMLLSLPLGERAFQQVIKAVRMHCARHIRTSTGSPGAGEMSGVNR